MYYSIGGAKWQEKQKRAFSFAHCVFKRKMSGDVCGRGDFGGKRVSEAVGRAEIREKVVLLVITYIPQTVTFYRIYLHKRRTAAIVRVAAVFPFSK